MSSGPWSEAELSLHARLWRIVSNVVSDRQGGAVQRAHTIRSNTPYTNAHHQWGVAMLFYRLWPTDFPACAAALLTHDVPEGWMGDTPSPVKKASNKWAVAEMMLETQLRDKLDLPDPRGLTNDLQSKMKFCDYFELYLWAREEQLRGNQYANSVLQKITEYIMSQEWPEPAISVFGMAESSSLVPDLHGILEEIGIEDVAR